MLPSESNELSETELDEKMHVFTEKDLDWITLRRKFSKITIIAIILRTIGRAFQNLFVPFLIVPRVKRRWLATFGWLLGQNVSMGAILTLLHHDDSLYPLSIDSKVILDRMEAGYSFSEALRFTRYFAGMADVIASIENHGDLREALSTLVSPEEICLWKRESFYCLVDEALYPELTEKEKIDQLASETPMIKFVYFALLGLINDDVLQGKSFFMRSFIEPGYDDVAYSSKAEITKIVESGKKVDIEENDNFVNFQKLPHDVMPLALNRVAFMSNLDYWKKGLQEGNIRISVGDRIVEIEVLLNQSSCSRYAILTIKK